MCQGVHVFVCVCVCVCNLHVSMSVPLWYVCCCVCKHVAIGTCVCLYVGLNSPILLSMIVTLATAGRTTTESPLLFTSSRLA